MTLLNAAIVALTIQCASAFAPTKSYPRITTTSLSETATAFDLNEYLASKVAPIEAALAASVESRIP